MAHAQKEADLWPWVCPCGRINKKQAITCALCHTHWSQGKRHDTTPKVYQWQQSEDWDWTSNWNQSQGDSGRNAQSPRGRQKGQTGKSPRKRSARRKGKGMPPETTSKGKFDESGPDAMQPSPLNASAKGGQATMTLQPWPSFEPMGFGPFPTSATAASASPFPAAAPVSATVPASGSTFQVPSSNIEMATAKRQSCSSRSSGNLGSCRPRTGSQQHQSPAFGYHQFRPCSEEAQGGCEHAQLSTSYVDQAHHRSSGDLGESAGELSFSSSTAHGTGCVCSNEVGTAHKQIAELSARVDGSKAPEPPPAIVEENATEETDLEEQQMRSRLQDALKACASALGVEMPTAQPQAEIQIIPDDDEGDRVNKRQRSTDPGRGWPCFISFYKWCS
eukprot:s1005_g50.t1